MSLFYSQEPEAQWDWVTSSKITQLASLWWSQYLNFKIDLFQIQLLWLYSDFLHCPLQQPDGYHFTDETIEALSMLTWLWSQDYKEACVWTQALQL